MRPERSKLVALAALSLVSLGASCDKGGAKQPQSPAAKAPAASGDRIEKLDGVDITELTDAEVELWVGLVNEQLSPCGDPLSVARCEAGSKP